MGRFDHNPSRGLEVEGGISTLSLITKASCEATLTAQRAPLSAVKTD